MTILLQALQQNASRCPDKVALAGSRERLSYGELSPILAVTGHRLRTENIGVLGLLANNGLPWALADLSALAANVPLVPLPLFFSPRQILHVIRDAGMDGLLTDQLLQAEALLQSAGIEFHVAGELGGLHLLRLRGLAARPLTRGTAKVSYTSGTTGEPKGVCLSQAQMESVAVSLLEASGAQASDRHLCLTPLSTLLENIGGIYTPLLAGATACVLPLQEVGLSGASGLDSLRMLQALREPQASSAILAPQMLQALVVAGESGQAMPPLRFVAVGGAPVSAKLLQRAQQLGIPVFEGYGLSECASVVTLNRLGANHPGTVGQPLPHITLSFSADGEILVAGSVFLGYLGGDAASQPWPTGDLGHVDADGFLHLTGRKKSIYITAYGRNVAPEWVEQELTEQVAIAQAAVFGEARPFNVAILCPRPGFSSGEVDAAISLANQTLPDYARISAWLATTEAFSLANGQLTTNGRLRREAIYSHYGDAIELLYGKEKHDVL